MAAFLRKNDLPVHRLGVTASTKAIGKSVDRNRARRLLREVFRRSRSDLNALGQQYDWVINAKRSLLSSNEELRFREFRRIVEQVARDERGWQSGPDFSLWLSNSQTEVCATISDAFYFDFAFEVLQSSNLAVVAAVLPFCSNLLRICARSNWTPWSCPRNRYGCLAPFALPAVLRRRLRPGEMSLSDKL